jgi:hypothetical protein
VDSYIEECAKQCRFLKAKHLLQPSFGDSSVIVGTNAVVTD